MCARLLACPLCSQPGFLTLDALRAGLVSVATRPLVCPVCNEVLLGIDKLTIHLFGHDVNLSNKTAESSKYVDVIANEQLVAIHNAHINPQDWNVLKAQQDLGKGQTLNGNNKTCVIPLDSNIPDIENISTVNSYTQSHVQNKNSLARKDTCQLDLISDYNYDLIKLNILSSSNETCDIMSKPITNLQQLLKTNCATQYSCNDSIKHSNMLEVNIQTEKSTVSDDLIDVTKVTEVMNTDVSNKFVERDSTESNNSQHTAKERKRLMINLIEEDNNLPNFQSIQNVLPMCENVSPEKCNNEHSFSNTKETSKLVTSNDENQDENLKHKQTSLDAQTCAKILAAPKSEDKTERCNICGFHFSDIHILALHKQLVHEQDLNNISGKILKNYSCHLCSKVFKMRGSLMVHMRVAHIGYNLGSSSKNDQIDITYSDTGYTCPTCGKRFKKEQHVIQHLKTHEGKQWECDTCSKMFTTKYFLKKHKRLHSGEMPYKCKICDKSFTFQQSYHKHRLYHKDDKPHTCTTCGRSFKELSTLHNHERIHTGEKPFACETCGKCFRQRVSYLVHRRIHTGVMPYKCTMCDKSFRYKVSQRTHKCLAQISSNSQQLSDSTIVQDIDDKTSEQQINEISTMQEDQTAMRAIDNEKNKFVLIINAQGQHVLALQSKTDTEFKDTNNTNEDSKSKTCNTNSLNIINVAESTESIKRVQMDNEKVDIKDTNDLFSMVMSPTFEMEHLRVSSPKHKEDSIDCYTVFPQVSDNAQINITESDLEQNFTCKNVTGDSLQTINEESLKELLYSIIQYEK